MYRDGERGTWHRIAVRVDRDYVEPPIPQERDQPVVLPQVAHPLVLPASDHRNVLVDESLRERPSQTGSGCIEHILLYAPRVVERGGVHLVEPIVFGRARAVEHVKPEHASCCVCSVAQGRVLEVAEEGPLAQRPAPVERMRVLVSIIRVSGQVSVVPHEEDPRPLQAARCCDVPVEHV